MEKLEYFDLPRFYQLFHHYVNDRENLQEKMGTLYSAYCALCSMNFGKLANTTLNNYSCFEDLNTLQIAEFVDSEWVEEVYQRTQIEAQNARNQLTNG